MGDTKINIKNCEKLSKLIQNLPLVHNQFLSE